MYELNKITVILAVFLSASFTSGAKVFVAEASVEEVISTANRRDTAIINHVGNISVMSRDHMMIVNAAHISELAARMSGVNFARNNGQEYLASIRSPILTGAGACGAFFMAQDGIALRSSGWSSCQKTGQF
ncbi:hypothetical protein [Paremcibacter congregatus]|uniref:hypothetical protein n=1 Tax=Paremcibacter congregatus TaxID=2043170 RepID=UPI003A8D223C